MKKLALLIGILIIPLLIFSLKEKNDKEDTTLQSVKKRSGTAIIMTGAAARIPQEAALLEELYNRGLMKDVVFISGVSSGALNAVMLNGILSGRLSWAEYKEILFNIKNSDIFIQEKGKKLPVNTEPARNLFKKIAEERLGYHQIGDLPIMTSISITNLRDFDLKKKVYRMCSRKINKETDTTLSLVDIMMASTSFPIAFPSVRINNANTIPDVEYVDGGVGDDHVPFQALLQFQKFRGAGVEKVYFISRKSDSLPEISEELKVLGIDDKGRFDKMGISLDHMMKKGLIKRLEAFASEAPDMIMLSKVYVPDFEKDFLMFNFGELEEQYSLTRQWAKTHDPMPLGDFLLYNTIRKK
jgi:predicted acylesterase/phospholipase RssA